VWLKSNPHRWSTGDKTLVVAYDDPEAAENFVATHPQYHYRSGEKDPAVILEVQEIELGKVREYWNPSFP
jgi:hypothetical protein